MGVAKHSQRRRLVIRLSIIVSLIVVLVAFRFVQDIGYEKQPNERFIVVDVEDGDTFTLAGGDKVRLLSIDTPEKGEPLYDEATRFLSDLVLGKAVRIEYASKRRDKYGRLLGYIYVDSLFVNRAIIENGLACLYLFKDTESNREETKILLQSQRSALERNIGLWSLHREKEDYYVARPGSFRFHRPGCGNLRRSNSKADRIFDNRREALWEGLSPCRRCKP